MLMNYLKMFAALPMPMPEGFKYNSLHGLILAEGRSFDSAPLTTEQHRYVREVLRRDRGRYPWKQCFSTSQRVICLSDFQNRLTYHEGVAVSRVIPVHHGWLVLDNERVIDLTWRRSTEKNVRRKLEHTRVFGDWPEGWEYRGVHAATRDEIRRRALETGEWASFLDNFRYVHPLYLLPKTDVTQDLGSICKETSTHV